MCVCVQFYIDASWVMNIDIKSHIPYALSFVRLNVRFFFRQVYKYGAGLVPRLGVSHHPSKVALVFFEVNKKKNNEFRSFLTFKYNVDRYEFISSAFIDFWWKYVGLGLVVSGQPLNAFQINKLLYSLVNFPQMHTKVFRSFYCCRE